MTDTDPSPPRSPGASPMFLRDDELRRGIELLHFAQRRLAEAGDAVLDDERLGRAHARALYFIARRPGLAIGDLLGFLGITKQSLGRVLNELADRGLVDSSIGRDDRRQRMLKLTATGDALEARLFSGLREAMASAYNGAGQEAVTGFWRVLEGLLQADDRHAVARLAQSR